jgi:hypothetical protein
MTADSSYGKLSIAQIVANLDQLTFVLTIALSNTGRDGQDLLRFRLLLATIERYFDKDCLDRFIIVTRAIDMPLVREVASPSVQRLKIEILNEDDVCPEFRDNPNTLNHWPRPNTGWFRQQLIKLAIYEHVATPFYMTLDSDVLFVRKFNIKTLFPDGRAALNVQTPEDLHRIYREKTAELEVLVRQTRYQQAERILQTKRNRLYCGHWYGETPVLLNRRLVEKLAAYIEKTWGISWRRALLENLPWTEYPLYFLFAEQSQLLEKYYILGTANSVLRLSQSLWHPAADYPSPRDLSNWNVDEIFGVESDGVAVVVQSYLEYPVAAVANKIRAFV